MVRWFFALTWLLAVAVCAGRTSQAKADFVAQTIQEDEAEEEQKGDDGKKESQDEDSTKDDDSKDSEEKPAKDEKAEDEKEEKSDSKDADANDDESKVKADDDSAKAKKEAAAGEESKAKEEAAKKSDEAEGEKKTTEEKPAAEKKAEEKKPETHKVETKDLKIEVEVEGVFVAEETEEVALRPEVWSSFKVKKAVPHGKRVRKNEVLVEFDDKEIEEALAQKGLEQRVGELTLLAAEEEFPRLEKSVEMAYEMAERDRDEAADEYDRFEKTMRDMSEKLANYYLKSAEQDLDNAREELEQLEKMYEADELTEETEEIVLRRQKFMVQQAEFFMEYSKINHEYTTTVSIPRREKALQNAVEESKLSFERAKMAKSLGLNKERYDLAALRKARTRSVENHAKLVADRALMTLRAPADGIAYYGRALNGRWIEVSSMESKLIPFGTVTPNSVVMTIVKDRPMYVETSIGEKELPTVEKGQTVVVTPVSDDEVELEASVEKLADVPGGGNKFAVRVELKDHDKAPKWLMPGMSAKAKIKTYETKDAVVLPAELVQSAEDEPKKKYVMVQVEDEEKPVRRDIKLGKTKDKNVEVLKGLAKGDLVVKGAKDEKADDDDKEDEK